MWAWFEETTFRFDGWYVNLEEPHVRDAAGVYSGDHVLDVVVEPDRSRRRKDEDELALAVAQGRYTPEEAARIEAAAAQAEAVVDAWASPFCDGWEDFRPDPAWPLPELSEP
jgi:predicted RNA-binding protein associated with RNAse of E/G family